MSSMSAAVQTIFGIDVHPEYQRDLNLDIAAGQDYDFTWIKASEGPYRDGSVYVPSGFKEYYKRAKRAGSLIGLYHFLVESVANNPERSGELQAEHFMNTINSVGGPTGKMLCVDFEEYTQAAPWLTPTNGTLKAFISAMRHQVGDHPIVLYSGRNFWNNVGIPSGSFAQYGADVAWDAMYLDTRPHAEPKKYYESVERFGWGKPWGGVEPKCWQFTSAGQVARMNIDVNAFRGTRAQLLALAGRRETHPKPKPNIPPNSLPPGTPRMLEGYPPYPGASTQWSKRSKWVIGEIRKAFPGVVCATYDFHGRSGEPWGIDIMVSPFRQKANEAQESLGDRIQVWLENNWLRLGIDYIIWWNWMNDGNGWFDYTPWSRPASEGGWPHGDPHPVPRRHEDHLHVQVL